ncbi:hypothetical protein EBZ39_13920 [bacterium]|nr:hypothetical protein [bacterium]
MKFRPQSILVLSLGFAGSIWWLSIQNYSSMDERSYSRDECAEDLCKVLTDLARMASARGDLAAAIYNLEQAIKHKPDDIITYRQLVTYYQRAGNNNGALQTYFASLLAAAPPNRPDVLNNQTALPLPSEAIAWRGEDLRGRSILVTAPTCIEQTIRFLRFLPLLRQRGGMVSFDAPARLRTLLQKAHLGINVLDENTSLLRHPVDYYVPLTSVPALLRIDYETMPRPQAYLHLPAAAPKKQPTHDALVVGLYLQDVAHHGAKAPRFAAASLFHELAALPGVVIKPLDTDKTGMGLDTLAEDIVQCDMVVAVKSVAVDLAGALGVPVWGLMPYEVEEEWLPLDDNATSVWYPTLRLFRQPKPGDWLSVFADVHDALHQRAQAHSLSGDASER